MGRVLFHHQGSLCSLSSSSLLENIKTYACYRYWVVNSVRLRTSRLIWTSGPLRVLHEAGQACEVYADCEQLLASPVGIHGYNSLLDVLWTTPYVVGLLTGNSLCSQKLKPLILNEFLSPLEFMSPIPNGKWCIKTACSIFACEFSPEENRRAIFNQHKSLTNLPLAHHRSAQVLIWTCHCILISMSST